MTGREIYRWRETQRISREELARRLGCSTQSIYRWEHDKAKPSPLAVERLRAIMGAQAA